MKPHIETLTLPEPARTLWPDCHTLLERFFASPESPDGGYVVGGGTILAARLGHRTSSDIDPIITSQPDLLEYLDGGPRHAALCEAMNELGFSNRRDRPPLQITLAHACGMLDLFTGMPFPPAAPAFAELDGKRVAVASNLQIMTGKLRGRATRAPVRDLIDLAVIAVMERETCRQAINAVPATTLATLPAVLTQRRNLYREESIEDESWINSSWQHFKHDPARHAMDAIRELTWQRIDVTYGPEGAFFTACEGSRPRLLDPEPITRPDAFDRRLAELGIVHGLHRGARHSHGADRMLRAMASKDLTVARIKEVKFIESTALERDRSASSRNPRTRPPTT